ncbi:MAG: CocE/NonD family hydrolase C-terminal non-catalytic domain-containing protein, partial [Acidimicrobiales bacterium]
PSLAAITPLSVYGDSGTGVLRPGGLLNTGFAVSWVDQVLSNAQPSGASWVREVIDGGDETCADNQRLRHQNVDVIAKAFDNPFYTEEVAAPLDIRRFAGDIDVPVFLASAWQDEQTGPSFADLLDDFDSSPVTRFTLYNGLHADGFAPQVLAEWKAFLDLYVAEEVPTISAVVRGVAPVFTESVFGGALEMPTLDRFDGVRTVESARDQYEAEPDVRVIFESGAGDPEQVGVPVGTFEHTAEQWPHPDVSAQRWYFEANGRLVPAAPSSDVGVQIQPDPSVVDTTFWSGGSSGLWVGTPAYDWQPAPDGLRADFETPALEEPLTMLGTGSVDLWVQSTDDPAIEVVVSEIRPDGQEMLVQSGRLRGSYRALEPESTELHPVQLGREADIAPLPSGEWTEMRVAIPAFGHVFRQGSKVRITVNTPGGDQARWSYANLVVDPDTENLIGTGGIAPSSVALPVLEGAHVPSPLPPCPSLRGQPCRDAPAISNVVVDTRGPADPPTCDADTTLTELHDLKKRNVHAKRIRCLVALCLLQGGVPNRLEPGNPATHDHLARCSHGRAKSPAATNPRGKP